MKNKLKKFYMKGRFQELKGYKVDKYIIRVAFALCLVFLIYAFYWGVSQGSYYVSCSSTETFFGNPQPCENPFYNQCNSFDDDWQFLLGGSKTNVEAFARENGLCDMETIQPGMSYGVKAPFIVGDVIPLTFLIILLAFILNHFVHNRNQPGDKGKMREVNIDVD